MPAHFISRQLSHPARAFARVMGWLMNRHNAKMNAFAVERLELGPSDRVLEIGFGGGVALRSLVGRATLVGGVDLSRAMVDWLTKNDRTINAVVMTWSPQAPAANWMAPRDTWRQLHIFRTLAGVSALVLALLDTIRGRVGSA